MELDDQGLVGASSSAGGTFKSDITAINSYSLRQTAPGPFCSETGNSHVQRGFCIEATPGSRGSIQHPEDFTRVADKGMCYIGSTYKSCPREWEGPEHGTAVGMGGECILRVGMLKSVPYLVPSNPNHSVIL